MDIVRVLKGDEKNRSCVYVFAQQSYWALQHTI
jgi:hypothetical protein